MARAFLGPTMDVHAGGIDLIFPHHENEIAQSEAANGQPFCNCWMHNGFVNIDGEKMSKSLGNFRTLRDVCKDATAIRAFRLFVVTSQYRSPLNFNEEGLKAAASAIKRLDKLVANLEACKSEASEGAYTDPDVERLVAECSASFREAMDDDLNTPRAYAALFKLVKGVEGGLKAARKEEKEYSAAAARLALEAIQSADEVFGFFYDPPASWIKKKATAGASSADEDAALEVSSLPQSVQELIVNRTNAKTSKDYAEADRLRDELLSLGFAVKDAKGGEIQVTRVQA